MKVVGLAVIVAGWLVAVGSLVVTDATGVRLGATLVGLATSLAGIGALNSAHIENAVWKTRGH